VSATRERGKKTTGRPAASELEQTLGRATRRLLSLQRPDGWWVGELESNVTMTAQHLLLLEFLRLRDEDTTRRCANELLARRRPDGLWSIYWEGEPDLAATLESYAALRLAGLSADDDRLAAARRFCEERAASAARGSSPRIWLALFGLWPWESSRSFRPSSC
jgi:squalene-hopene/tetraprenyl-beta-curcumene cyclase